MPVPQFAFRFISPACSSEVHADLGQVLLTGRQHSLSAIGFNANLAALQFANRRPIAPGTVFRRSKT